jgi:dTDP-glucose 4,6-dehydratase
LAEIILELTGRSRNLVQHIGERPGQVDLHLAATDKIERLLGPGPARPLEDGLRQTIDWYRTHPDWWQRLAWMKHVKIVTASGCEEPH